MAQSRQLAAIMFTDIVGYTALMGHDEQKAFSILNKNRSLQRPIVEQFNGRWIKELGDGVMASFNTVSDAVNAAIKIQETCSAQKDFELRIGIHLSEVVFENGDVFGDGVNIAARIEAIATPGGIYISEAVQHNISNKNLVSTEFVKTEHLKNVKEPVRIYRVVNEKSNPLNQGNKIEEGGEQSIAVLPFINMSNDPEQEYFCDGVSEEITNALAQLNNLRVIARTSTFAFKGKNVDVREIGRILNVKTLLDGSVRKAGNRLRIITQLVRVSDGSNLWSERYDRVLEDVFEIQSDIAGNVAKALQVYLTNREKEAIRRPETNIEAYQCFLKGRQHFHQLRLNEAIQYFQKAIELDAAYAPAYAGLADVHSWTYEWEGGKQADLASAEKNSLKALSLAPDLAESHTSRAFVLSLGRRYEEAEEQFREAVRLNPNSFDTYYLWARAYFSRGEIEKSAEMFLKASEVRREDFQSPLLLSQSLRILGRRNEAVEFEKEGMRRARNQLAFNPDDRRVLSLASGNLYDLGQKEEAFDWINRAFELYPEDAGVLINGACLFAKANHKEKALDLLELAVNKGFGKKEWIAHDPDYDNLRNEPRFKALLKKLR